jgi:hypothetical protein
MTRRLFGGIALASLLNSEMQGAERVQRGLPGLPHFAARAKRVIYLFQSGGPSQIELFDHKPRLVEFQGKDLPESVRNGQRLTGMSASQSTFPVVPSKFRLEQRGQSGAWVGDLLPYTAKIADRLTFIKTVNTEEINHDPAVTMFQTGFRLGGRPSLGAWVSYGLGAETDDLPSFCVMISTNGGGQPLYDRLWGSAFLPSRYQGVKFRSGGDPVLFLSNPPGFSEKNRRGFLDALGELNKVTSDEFGDPETSARVAQYEMAFRMQTSVPDLTDISKEPASTFELYGDEAKKPGTFAANCLLARRLAERGVRFIQLYHRDWDHHGGLPENLPKRCKDVDQASAALVQDLAQRSMLQHHEGPGSCPRPAGDDPTLPRDRPQAPDLPVSGTRLPADRRRRRGGEAGPALARDDFVTFDFTVTDRDDAMGVQRDIVLVRDQDDGVAFLVQTPEERHDFVAGRAIEVSGGFVGQDDGRVVHQGAGDRDALTLTAGKLVGLMVHALFKVHLLERGFGLGDAGGRRGAVINQREFHVVERAGAGQKVERLEDEANFLVPDSGQFVVVHLADQTAIDVVFAL